MAQFRWSALLKILVLATLPASAVSDARSDPVVVGEEHCVVNVATNDALNLRAQPSASASVAVRKQHNACGIMVTGPCEEFWCRVEDGHFAGWVNRRFIAMVSPSLYCVSGVAAGDGLNLRAFPSPKSRVLQRLDPNQCDIAFLPYAVGGWQKIRVDGWLGWADRRYLSGQ